MLKKYLIFFIGVFFCIDSFAQTTATVKGRVVDEKNQPVEQITIAAVGIPGGTTTNAKGEYQITLPADTTLTFSIRSINYYNQTFKIKLTAGEVRVINATLANRMQNLPEAQVKGDARNELFMESISVKDFDKIPTPNMNFESMLKSMAPVVSNNELSSEYSVRGGSFDENLTYVNEVEIYRPQLTRSGQQEGLTLINPDMVEKVYFSAGGFEAKYGDKLSSVLDVEYRKPEKFGGSFEISFLGGSVFLEDASKNKRFTYMLGVRQKSSQYILSSLETKGEYNPSATDFQLYVTDSIGHKTEITFLGDYNINKYRVTPTNRETDFGTINEAYRLTVYFDGKEIDQFNTGTGALSITHRINEHLKLKLSGSAFNSIETESFDILGQYFIGELENDLGSDEFGNVSNNSDIGSYLNHARNELHSNVWNIEHKGVYSTEKNKIQWGVKFQSEKVKDNIWEWTYIDSAGFSVPNPFDSIIELNDIIIAENNLSSQRYSGFIQNTTTFGLKDKWQFNYGIRATYWSLNKEADFSPRISIGYTPAWKKRLSFKFATGIYYQPPFYREMRNLYGEVNENLKSQKAVHFILGSEYQFLMWGREFKLITEAYYKKLSNMVPYTIDNVRLKYLGTNTANGYAAGLDLRLNGELVEGAESWINVGLLKTEADITNDYYYSYYNSKQELIVPGYTFDDVAVDSIKHEPGYIPRPTDQHVTVTMFFQDYVPRMPRLKFNMTLIFGSGLPFGPPGDDLYKQVFRYPPYRRVDMGFTYLFVDHEETKKSRLKLFNKLNYFALSLEVFNLLQVNNTVSYLWVTDVSGRKYAVPNYLTARQLNLKMTVQF